MARTKYLILQAGTPAYFAGLQKGKLAWTNNPTRAYTFRTKVDAVHTITLIRRRNGHKPDDAFLVVPADQHTLELDK